MMEGQTGKINQLLKENSNDYFGHVKSGHALPPNLIIHLRNGNQKAFGYHYLAKQMEFNPSEGIHLFFLDPDGTKTVHIQGRNLLTLWDSLVWHKATYIKEQEYSPVEANESALCITAITIT